MALSIADAYSQLKNLENSGQITLPEPQETVTLGTIDPKAGTFTWTAPTVVQTTVIPPNPALGQRTNTFINVTVGIVSTKAVDLRLKFAVIPVRTQLVNAQLARSTALAPRTPAVTAPAATAAASPARVDAIGVAGGALGESNGGVTIDGFPTVISAANEIVVDAGLVCSTTTGSLNTVPPVSNFGLTINIPGHPQPIYVNIFILRPPVVGIGAFTIPALPMTIVYAPPQGKQQKNTATYSDTTTFTRTVTTTVTSSNTTKTVQAYSAADLIGKVAGAITTVAAVVGTGGAGAAGGASIAGAFSELASALVGPPKNANDSTADATKQISGELSLVSNILTAIDSSGSPSMQSTVTVENDHSLTLAVSSMNQFMAGAGLGPGLGDRIVYMRNVKAIWVAVNGEVGINLLGFDALVANTMQDLQQEQQSLTAGGAPRLGLDLDTIKSLLSQDPLVAPRKIVVAAIGAPLIGPPRFIPAVPAGHAGSGTGPGGDVVQVTIDTTTENKTVTSKSQTNITDMKPGWAAVLLGADNTETTTTAVLTNSTVTDDKSEDKITSTVTFFSQGVDDAYDVKFFYDCTFGTYLILNSNSTALQGLTVNVSHQDVIMAR